MSFVIGEAKRELNFYQNQNKSVGPNIGPGSYYTPQRYNSVENKAPFGTGSRRRLQAPFMEFFQDMQQFIFLQPKQFQNQAMADVKKHSPQDKEYPKPHLLNKPFESQQHSQDRLHSIRSKSVNSTQIVKPQVLQHNSKSLNSSALAHYTQMAEAKPKKKQKSSNNLQKILGMLNMKKGSVSIQSQNVRVLEEEEENDGQSPEEGSFFVTQEPSKHEKKPTIKELKNQLVKAVNMQESLRTRLDKGIVNWKKQDTSKKVGFVKDVLLKKQFMKDLGPGSYDTNVVNEVHVDYKHNPTSNFVSNTQRLQEMNLIKNQQLLSLQNQKQNNSEQPGKGLENSFLGVRTQPNEREEGKKRSNSQISSHLTSTYAQGSQFKIFKNGKIKESPTKDQLQYYRDQEAKLLKKPNNPNVRFELVNKEQYNLRNVGPGSYQVTKEQTQDHKGNTHFGLGERFYDSNKKISESKKIPGPGDYQLQDATISNMSRNLNKTFASNPENEKKYNTHSLFGPFKVPETTLKQRFVSTQARQLKLITEDAKNAPGPGQYNLNQEDLNLQISQLGDKELARAYFHIKQSSVFQSKAPRTVVFNQDSSKKAQIAFNHYYDNLSNTISKSQLDIVQKRLEKITYSSFKEPQAKNEFNLSSQIIDTFQTVDQRFKEDKRLLEMQNLGPGSYYQEQVDNKVKTQTNSKNKSNGSSMFKSQVPRIEGPNSQREPLKKEKEAQEQIWGNKVSESPEVPEKVYQSTMEKRSFNMKYNKVGVKETRKQ